MQQIKLNSNVVTTIRGCINNEGCNTTTLNGIEYENTCCFHNLCNSFLMPITKTTTSISTTTMTTISSTSTASTAAPISIQKMSIDESNKRQLLLLKGQETLTNDASNVNRMDAFFKIFPMLLFIVFIF